MRASNRRVLNAAAKIDSQETRKVQLHCQPVSNAIPLGSIQAALDGEETADILFELLANVVHRQHPEVAAVLRGKSEPGDFAPELLARDFQAHGIWFQLLAIVEQHTAMRLRRQTERVRGETAVQGTFASLIAEAANQGAAAQELRGLLASTRVRPVITAHPTEAKRVTG